MKLRAVLIAPLLPAPAQEIILVRPAEKGEDTVAA
jgi:hypothetical protein